jgi:hypothetical protein
MAVVSVVRVELSLRAVPRGTRAAPTQLLMDLLAWAGMAVDTARAVVAAAVGITAVVAAAMVRAAAVDLPISQG